MKFSELQSRVLDMKISFTQAANARGGLIREPFFEETTVAKFFETCARNSIQITYSWEDQMWPKNFEDEEDCKEIEKDIRPLWIINKCMPTETYFAGTMQELSKSFDKEIKTISRVGYVEVARWTA